MQTVLGLVAAGIGLAVVPSSVAALRRTGVTLRPLRGRPRSVTLAAVHPRTTTSPLLDAFLECLDGVSGRGSSGGDGPGGSPSTTGC